MTGRARGRSRGRGRTDAPPPGAEAARRPGEAPAARPPEAAQVGRGRSRGPPTDAAPPPRAAPAAQPPTAAMQQMSVSEPSQAARGPPRGGRFTEPVTRPAGLDKKGASGGAISLVSNCFLLEARPNSMLYQYNVSFSPEVDSKKVKYGLVAGLESTLGRVRAFDGMAMFLPIKLPDPVTTIIATRRRRDNPDGEPVEVKITLTNELPHDSPSVLHLFNIILKRVMKSLEMGQVGRQYYNTKLAIQIPQHNLEIWPGYATSILMHERGLLLGIDVSHKVLRTKTVLDYLYELYNKERQKFHEVALKKLLGEIVLTRYNNNTYRIDDISWDERPHMSFTTGRGETTYVDYYQKHYEKQISDMDQPLLIHKPKKVPGKRHIEEIKLLPEFCYLTGLSDEMRQDFKVMKDLAVHTRIDPTQRCKMLTKFINEINGNAEASAELEGWGLKFSRSLLSFKGRVLPAETIYQKNKKSTYDPKSADWSKETRGNSLHSTVDLENWVVVSTRRDSNILSDFVATTQRVLGPMGINCKKPREVLIDNDRTETYLNAVKTEIDKDQPQIVVVIVTTNRKDRYDAIKKLCCLEKPVPSQVVVSRTLSKKQMLMSVCTKIGIQLNCKLGGEAWALEIPLKNLMVVGIDCYHDSASKGRSVGGFVASMNQTLTRYYSRCTFQHNHQELVDGLRVCMTAALRKYQEINNVLPDRIIIFRDGVGDGQLQYVVEHEVSQLLESFKGIQQGVEYKPKFGMVVVKKRIQNRLFHQNERDGSLANPPPGTVCDSDITRPEWYDFFLVSQCVRQGTVTPTHFNVIYDTTGLRPDHFQRLSYKLTHLYYNWPGTVRVPAPCQYAHKLAFLVGQSLHKEPSMSLSDKLFFL